MLGLGLIIHDSNNNLSQTHSTTIHRITAFSRPIVVNKTLVTLGRSFGHQVAVYVCGGMMLASLELIFIVFPLGNLSLKTVKNCRKHSSFIEGNKIVMDEIYTDSFYHTGHHTG